MRWRLVILLWMGLISLTAIASGDWEARRDSFVAAVENGNDSALVEGILLQKELEAADGQHPYLPRIYLSIGNYYNDRVRLPQALRFYQKAKEIAALNNDSLFMAYADGSLGYLYKKSNRHKDALVNFKNNLDYWKATDNKPLQPVAISNIVDCLIALNRLDEAKKYLIEGLAFCEAHNLLDRVNLLYFRLARIAYIKAKSGTGSMDKAMQWARKARASYIIHDKSIEHEISHLMGQIYLAYGQADSAANRCKGVYIYHRVEELHNQLFLDACTCLAEARLQQGRNQEAMLLMWEYVREKEALVQKSQTGRLGVMELEHQLHNQLFVDSLKAQNERKLLVIKQENEKQQNDIYIWTFISLGIIVAGAGYYVRQNHIQQRQTYKQLQVVNKEIKDSISYAKHIQEAFLPAKGVLQGLIADSFLLYLPKDIVAGDFYWFHEEGDKMLLAVADCTGHGVPGAMVSAVCHGALHKATKEVGLSDAAEILNRTRETVVQRFLLDGQPMRDGMDISLVIIDRSYQTAQFAGAQNPLWIVRAEECITIRGDKQPVGAYEHAKPFRNHSIDLQPEDCLYLFSDGFADQFGGDKGKKLKSSAFKKLLLSLSKEPMRVQKQRILRFFEEWMQDYEQLDDVCVLGARIQHD